MDDKKPRLVPQEETPQDPQFGGHEIASVIMAALFGILAWFLSQEIWGLARMF